MENNFKYGFILKYLFNKYFSKINNSPNYNELISETLKKDALFVFVGKSVDFIQYLYLNHTLKSLKLPDIGYVNELTTSLWETPTTVLSKIFSKKETTLKESLKLKKPAMIFLRKSNLLGIGNYEFKDNPLIDLIKIQKNSEIPIYIIPKMLVLKKEAETIREAINHKKNPNAFHITYQLIRFYKNANAKILDPISLKDFIIENKNKSDLDLAESLYAKLIYKIEKEEEIIKGPIIKGPKFNIDQIIASSEIQKAIEDKSKLDKKNKEVVEELARKTLKKIAANYQVSYIRKFSAILSLIFKKIYDDLNMVDDELESLKELSKEYTLVLTPCHKSHMDYLVLSHLFFKKGMIPPHIAAGDNLSFFPMGTLFRRSGAFFIKRTFRHDPFYSAIFKQYLTQLINDRFSIEFFIEGTRSRTGKLMPPKIGMLSMIIDYFKVGINKKIAIVPVSVNYERVIEEKSYLKELSGMDKEKEGVNSIIGSRKVLQSKFGRIYIRFGDPVKLDKYCENSDKSSSITNKIAYELLDDINRKMIVTASAILGTSLLTLPKTEKVEFSELLGRFLSIHKILSNRRDIPMSNTLLTPVLALEEAIEFFIGNNHISILDKESELYRFTPQQRAGIEYYKNNIIHHFINEAIVISSIKRFSDFEESKKEAIFLSEIFQDEFIINPELNYEDKFYEVLERIKNESIVKQEDDKLFISDENAVLKTQFYDAIIRNFFESYYFCFKELSTQKDGKISYKNFLKHLIQKGNQSNKEILYQESINKNKFENALKTLSSRDIIEFVYEGKNKDLILKNKERLLQKVKILEFYLCL
ncbi:1-acyl-sn-glycerol-3-phosphate acyltransferase [bacterium]|nr:1-acyl-sn-glycerol-3-phosphate acyltransferase [bacterium]